MIQGLWHKYTSPSTKYEKGQIATSKQAEAASQVDKLEALVRDIGDSMAAIDDTFADRNGNTPNSVYGSVHPRQIGHQGTPFTGSCQLKDGQVASLDVNAGSTSLSVSRQGDRQEIHYVTRITGSCSFDPGPNVLEQHEWAISDGSKVKYKSYSYFSYGDS